MNPRLIGLLFCLVCTTAYAHLRVQVTPAQLQPGDVATLILDEDHSVSSDPDLSPLQKDFMVQGQSRGTTLQIINGNVSEQTEVQVSLLPRHAGTLIIPILHWGSDSSQALSVQVPNTANTPATPPSSVPSQQNTAGQNDTPHVFVKEVLQHPDIYLQTPELLSVEVFTDQPLYQASLDLQGNADVMVQPWGKDSRSEQVVHGQSYQVITRQFLVIPQRHGTLTLPAASLDAQIQDNSLSSLFGPGAFGASFGLMHPIHLSSEPTTIHVSPWPTNAQGTPLLPSKGLSTHLTMTPTSGHINVGQPLMIHIHEEGLNVTGEDLPDPTQNWTMPQGIRIFPDPAHLTMKRENNTWIGVRDQDIALVADQPGDVLVPETKNAWWDTSTHIPALSITPSISLHIKGISRTSTTPATVSPTTLLPTQIHDQNNNTTYWRTLSFLLAAGWFLSLLGWFITWRTLSARIIPDGLSAREKKPRHRQDTWQLLQQALKTNDPNQVHRALHAWARIQWPEYSDSNLFGIPLNYLDATLRNEINALDRACFSPDTHWNSQSLLKSLNALKQRLHTREPQEKNRKRLDNLYND